MVPMQKRFSTFYTPNSAALDTSCRSQPGEAAPGVRGTAAASPAKGSGDGAAGPPAALRLHVAICPFGSSWAGSRFGLQLVLPPGAPTHPNLRGKMQCWKTRFPGQGLRGAEASLVALGGLAQTEGHVQRIIPLPDMTFLKQVFQ